MTKIGDDVTEIMMLSCATKMRASFLAPGKFLSFSGTLRVRVVFFVCLLCSYTPCWHPVSCFKFRNALLLKEGTCHKTSRS